MEDKQLNTGNHKVNLIGRRTAIITGVKDVLSFDAGEVLLETEMGILMIRGDELHVNHLSLEKGEVNVDGKVDSFTYSDAGNGMKSGESLLGRLFK
jgi:sporulation protein YabP